MKSVVLFRDFEERDIDAIYRWKNDEKLYGMTVGGFHSISYEEAVKWVHGCIGNHETYKFWAVCTNDEEKKIVGYVSISEINLTNSSAQFHSMLIGEPSYRGGAAWIQCYQFVLEYVFEVMGLNRLAGKAITEHPQTITMMSALHFVKEGIERQSVFRNNRYYDVQIHSLLKQEYFNYKSDGDYEFASLLKRIVRISQKNKLIANGQDS